MNGYAVQSLAYSLPFDVRGAADVIEVPVLIVHSERALAPDLARAFHSAVKSPQQELWLESQGQIDFYDDPKLIAPAADAVATFFRGRQIRSSTRSATLGFLAITRGGVGRNCARNKRNSLARTKESPLLDASKISRRSWNSSHHAGS